MRDRSNECTGDQNCQHVCPERTIESYQAAHDLRERVKELESTPLPPTAEQTSIARFNALADQIREIADQLRLLIDDERSRFATLTAHQDRLYSAVAERYEWVQTRVLLNLTNSRLMAIEKAIKPRAVAKKKAAPLVGKKGTGRKG